MAAKKYTCTNFANCDAALSKEVIEIEDGEDVACPSCKSTNSLEPAGGRGGGKAAAGGGGSKKKPLILVGAVVAAGVLVYALLPGSPNPAMAETMVTDYFQRLK